MRRETIYTMEMIFQFVAITGPCKSHEKVVLQNNSFVGLGIEKKNYSSSELPWTWTSHVFNEQMFIPSFRKNSSKKSSGKKTCKGNYTTSIIILKKKNRVLL